MILINDILVEDRIATNYFECDLEKCKGACCTFPGEYGAPLLEEEVDKIREVFPIVKEYLSEKSLNYIKEHGQVQGDPEHHTTMCIDKKDCVFVYYEGEIALCEIEKAYRDGKIDFKKPISCHLFPIRVGYYNGQYLYYEKISQCNPAIPNGFEKNVKIHQSVSEALIRSFGKEWYDKYLKELGQAK